MIWQKSQWRFQTLSFLDDEEEGGEGGWGEARSATESISENVVLKLLPTKR